MTLIRNAYWEILICCSKKQSWKLLPVIQRSPGTIVNHCMLLLSHIFSKLLFAYKRMIFDTFFYLDLSAAGRVLHLHEFSKAIPRHLPGTSKFRIRELLHQPIGALWLILFLGRWLCCLNSSTKWTHPHRRKWSVWVQKPSRTKVLQNLRSSVPWRVQATLK